MAQAIITPPPTRGTVDRFEAEKPAGVSQPFTSWFQSVFLVCFGLTQSGTTLQRPTTNLWPGRMYFDTSLASDGRPIWVNKDVDGWVDGDGNSV